MSGRRRARRTVVIALAVVTAAATFVGVDALVGPPERPQPAADAVVTSTTPKVRVTKVAASSTSASGNTTVRTVLTVENATRRRTSTSDAWVYLSAGRTRIELGHVTVPKLGAGASRTIRTSHRAPSRASAGTYAVVVCVGPYSAENCLRSGATVRTTAAKRDRPDTGVMLDVARAYYPVPLIERYIDLLAVHGGRFLHLHLTDDQNVGIESAVLGQTPANATLHDGVWTSRVTGRPFLSTAQARQIAAYASKHGVAVVPEVDTPGHMAAAFELLEARHGKAWVDRIRSGDDELDPSAPGSSALAAALLSEVTTTFPSSRTVHIGGDEWGADVTAGERVAWLNAMAAAVGNREVWAWNDGIDRKAVARLDPRVHVTYWSFDGDTEDPAERRERRQTRATASDLSAAGIELRNYNSYYLYEVPTDLDESDSEYTVADLREHWSLRAWDGDSGARLATPMSGAAVAIWGEDLEAPPSEALLRWSSPHIVTMIEVANS
ncbi:MAG: family 20 glycosylhydrolase [Curtobacterium sp.]